jgi:hypothetical protein
MEPMWFYLIRYLPAKLLPGEPSLIILFFLDMPKQEESSFSPEFQSISTSNLSHSRNLLLHRFGDFCPAFCSQILTA